MAELACVRLRIQRRVLQKQTNKNKTTKRARDNSSCLCGGLAAAGQVWFDAFVYFWTLSIIVLISLNQRLRHRLGASECPPQAGREA